VTGRARIGAQALALACVAGLLGLLVWKLAHQQHAPPVGSTAPGFTLTRLAGPGKVSLASLHGDAVVLNFWASWCGPCKGEAPVLERAWAQYHDKGVIFLGVDYHDLAPDARKFVVAHGLSFPMLEDGSGAVTGAYGVSQVPETYVLDRSGRIVAHLRGPVTSKAFGAQFEDALKAVA
jgi:peroxiredoxin